jgi:hypothetical protein
LLLPLRAERKAGIEVERRGKERGRAQSGRPKKGNSVLPFLADLEITKTQIVFAGRPSPCRLSLHKKIQTARAQGEILYADKF